MKYVLDVGLVEVHEKVASLFTHLIFPNHNEAKTILDTINEIQDAYDQVTVADVCDLLGIPCEYQDTNKG